MLRARKDNMQGTALGCSGSREKHYCALRQPLSRCVQPGLHLAVMRSHSSSRRMQMWHCKAVDLQDGVLPQLQAHSSRVQTSEVGQDSVTLPTASNMQAQVMLVPKKDTSTALLRQKPTAEDPMGKFLLKCKLAWNLFFPPQHDDSHPAAATPKLSPKDLGKQRLQMILVADRCGLSPNSLVEMKRNTLAALADCMDLEDLQDAHLRFTMTREGGTTYSMAVPILRPGPYTEDGSVVEQGAKSSAAGAVDAMVAAAAAAGAAGWQELDDSEDVDNDDDDDSGYYPDDDEDTLSYAYDCSQPSPLVDAVYSEVGLGELDNRCAAEQQQPAIEDIASGASKAAEAVSDILSDSVQGEEQLAPVAVGVVVSDQDFKKQLRELLVEELVHDVEELVQHTSAELDSSAAAAAAELGDVYQQDAGEIRGSSSSSPITGFSEQELREVAVQEVQRLVGEEDTLQEQ